MPETTFYNMWRTKSAADRASLLAKMREEAPALAGRPGFVSMTVLECQEDGRVLVEGRWQSRDAYDAAVTKDLAAKKSRDSLSQFGSPDPGLFDEVFRVLPPGVAVDSKPPEKAFISSDGAGVTFIQVWRLHSRNDQQRWLQTMHSRIGLLTVQPGFVSMSLHASLDGMQTAVYAQWKDEESLKAAVSLPEAVQSHDEMARWGSSDGMIYRVDSVYLPEAPLGNQITYE